MNQADLLVPIPLSWKQWLLLNRDRGCNFSDLIETAKEAGYHSDAIKAVLELPAEAVSEDSVPSWLEWFEAPLTKPEHSPRAWRLDTPLAQVYELPDFLSTEECQSLIEAIDRQLVPSTVTRGNSSYRTSRTCHLRDSDADLAEWLDQRLATLFSVDPVLSESLQGQRYDQGQYFKEHTDWFAPGTKEFATHTNPGGQRTWTVMIYLNTVVNGGQTCFKRLNRCFRPIQGLALAWNNLMADGTPNPFTLHEAMPVNKESKWVITKWFRAETGRNN